LPKETQKEILTYVPKTEFFMVPANIFQYKELPSDDIRRVVVSNNMLLVAHDLGISISHDGGKSFINRTVTNGLASNDAKDIAVAVYNNSSIIVVATTDGLSISSDGGISFITKAMMDGLGDHRVSSVFVSGQHIYVGGPKGLSISW